MLPADRQLYGRLGVKRMLGIIAITKLMRRRRRSVLWRRRFQGG